MEKYVLDNRPLVLLGDTHSVNSIVSALSSLHKVADGLNILHLGDTGFAFNSRESFRQMKYLQPMLSARNNHLWAIRGNHDLRSLFTGIPFGNITLLKDYSVLAHRGKTILAVGGSISVDREMRLKENWPYDPQEIPDPIPDSLKEFNCDMVCAHDIPQGIFVAFGSEFAPYSAFVEQDLQMKADTISVRELMQSIFDMVSPRSWYCGHYHRSFEYRTARTNYRILAPNELYSPL